MKPRYQNLLVGFSAFFSLSNGSLHAVDLRKANNTEALNTAISWVENVVPGATDNLIWDSTRTAAGLYSFGNNQFTGGVTIQNPGGLVQFRVVSSGTTTWANNALIDMSAATVDAEWTGGTLRIDSNNFNPAVTVASNRTLTLGGNGITNRANTKTLTMAGGGNIIITANMGSGGAMNFNVNGPTVTMNNAASGWTFGTVTSGKLVLATGTVLDGKRLVMNSANGLEFGAGVTTASLGGLEGSGGFALTNADTNAVALTIGSNNSSHTASGNLGGAGSLTKVGGGTQTLSGDNSFAGGIFLNAGAITFGHSNAAAGGLVTAANGTTVNLANSNSVFLNGTIAVSGAGSNVVASSSNISAGFSSAFTAAADQTLTISGANQVNIGANFQQFSGMNGTVAVASGATLRFSSSSLNNGGSNTTFDLTGNLVTRNNGSLALGALSGNGNISMGGAGPNSGQLFLSIGAKGLDTTYGGAISDADTSNGKIASVTKTGAGIQTLSGTNTYTGATTINGGTLKLDATGTIDNTSGVSLGTAGTFDVSAKGSGYSISELTGSGDVLGALTVTTRLAIGNSPGTIDFSNDLTLGGASAYTYELTGGSFGVNSADLGNVTGNITITSGATLDLVQLGSYTIGDKFTLFAYSGSVSGTFDGLANGAEFTDAGGLWEIDYFDDAAGTNGGTGTGFVTVTAIPEPSAVLVAGLGMMLLLGRRRA